MKNAGRVFQSACIDYLDDRDCSVISRLYIPDVTSLQKEKNLKTIGNFPIAKQPDSVTRGRYVVRRRERAAYVVQHGSCCSLISTEITAARTASVTPIF